MDLNQSQSAPDITARLRMILAGLRAVMGMWGLDGALVIVLSNRTGRIFGQIERMLARFRAGKLRRMPVREAGQTRSRGVAGRGPALPRTFGWMVKAGKYQAVAYRSQLEHLLRTEPEMAAMLEASPQARRVMRPLLRALAIELPWTVTPPRAPRLRKSRKPRPKPETFKIALPRGVITWARREKRLERAREELNRLRALA